MSIYSRKQRWKLFLLLGAVCIVIASLWYTNILVKKIHRYIDIFIIEKKKV